LTKTDLTITRSRLGFAIYRTGADGYEHAIGLFNSLAAAKQHLKALGVDPRAVTVMEAK
jgi:hypothetical protein